MTAWTYCTASEVAGYSGISEDRLRDEWSLAVQGMIDAHLGFSYYATADLPISVTISLDGDGTNILTLPHRPVLSVASLSIGGVSLTSSEYRLYGDSGYIRLVSSDDNWGDIPVFPVGVQNITVSYTHGSIVPDRVRMCAITMISMISLVHERSGSDGSIALGMSQSGVGGADMRNRSRDISGRLQSIMDNYLGKRWRVA